jgi:hypothetical protein
MLVSNASDLDGSTHSLYDGEFDADFPEGVHCGFRHAVNIFMAKNGENTAPDPFSTPLPPNATQQEIEDYLKALDEAKKKELTEREKFRLEQQTAENISCYRTRRMAQRLRAENVTRVLDFKDPNDP